MLTSYTLGLGLLKHDGAMYMTVNVMVIDAQNMRAIGKRAFSVIRRSFYLSHIFTPAC
jgi:hypothetical protein